MDDAAAWWGVVIAAVSLCVAMFALGWARETAKAARHANVLQLHDNQRKLLVAFDALHTKVFALQEAFEPVALVDFEEYSVTCYLYVSDNLSKRIMSYYEHCYEIPRNERKIALLENRLKRYTAETHEQFDEMCHELTGVRKDSDKFIINLISDGKKIVVDLRKEIKIEPPALGFWETVVHEYNKPFDWGDEKEPE